MAATADDMDDQLDHADAEAAEEEATGEEAACACPLLPAAACLIAPRC